ncbi:MAG: inorganic diphosphatase [Patescibacteria group bacterium]
MLNLSIGSKAPEVCQAVIEVPRGSQNKYEFDKEQGIVKLDRVLFAPMFYPCDYGFFPETLGGDGDPLDVLVMVTNPLFPGVAADVRPIGVLKMSDDKGQDEKILAVAKDDPRFKHINDLNDVPQHIRDEISFFFETYKVLEKKMTKIDGWADAAAAKAIIVEGMERFKKGE